MGIEILFVLSGRGKAQCPPNPAYPNGLTINAGNEGKPGHCAADLPYPAPECGMFILECALCGNRIAITAAGRPDDPRRVIIPCKTDQETGKPS